MSCPGYGCPDGTTSIKWEWDDNYNLGCGGFVVETKDGYLMDGSDKACFKPDSDGEIDLAQYDGFDLPVIITSVEWKDKDDNEIESVTYLSPEELVAAAHGWYKAGPKCEKATDGDAKFGVISTSFRYAISYVAFCVREPFCPIPFFQEKVTKESEPVEIELSVWDENGNGIAGVNFVDDDGVTPYLVNLIVTSKDGLLESTDGIHWTPTGAAPDSTVLVLTQDDVDVNEGGYFAQVVNGCGSINHIDPPLVFDEAPETFELAGNFPNPFNPTTMIGFRLAEPMAVNLVVYDVTGREVKRLLADQTLDAGVHEVEWDGTDVQGQNVVSGVYLYRVQAGNMSASGTMVLLK